MRPRGRPQGPCGQVPLPPSWSHVLFPRDTHSGSRRVGPCSGLTGSRGESLSGSTGATEGPAAPHGGLLSPVPAPQVVRPVGTDLPQCPVVSQTRAQWPPPGLVRTVQGAFRPGPAQPCAPLSSTALGRGQHPSREQASRSAAVHAGSAVTLWAN